MQSLHSSLYLGLSRQFQNALDDLAGGSRSGGAHQESESMDVDDMGIFTRGGPESDDEAPTPTNITVDLREMLRFQRFVLFYFIFIY